MVKNAWKEALRRARECLGFPIEKRYKLDITADGTRFAEVSCTERPFTIRISSGLPPFIYRVSRILAARSYAFSSGGKLPTNVGTERPFVETVEQLHRAFFWYSVIGNSTIHQDFDINGDQALFGGWIAFEAEVFVICHELAHGLITRLSTEAPEVMAQLEQGLENQSAPWREEFIADRLALVLAFGKFDKPHDGDRLSVAYAGWEFALLLHREWERYEEFENSEPFSSRTHPPAGERLDNLRATFRRCVGEENAERLLSTAVSLTMVFRNLVDAMFTPEFQASAIARDEVRARKLRELAMDCDRGDYPDYHRFIPAALEILQQGESWTLLDLVTEMTAPLRREVQFTATNFGITKLVWRASDDLPDPLYFAFKKQTRTPNLSDRIKR
ncbi:hypothetical protein FA04_27615 (plasmid) [Ensifer adhaerens]|uniref:Uncharacterized protein n=1 Tax=Ensifer adhaerens TaxID=106592 RepID=A0ABY8HTV0_ENSAD|nr:hypothetical protein [Ensifer adhaerens]ANK76522.1 hypothetical protein FA04_27615 [Ensifer adhaerens]KDP74019.1 hypothetical protein FA04_08815 [Ensifer adhaerens]WFP94935.1 hypothetical protein P4B07_27985 [Ensifer adhaerens]